MKIINNTSKQDLSYQDCKLWEDDIIKNLIKNDCEKEIIIDDAMVKKYNNLAEQDKSNASFVRRVKKILNDEFYCEIFDVWISINETRKYFECLQDRSGDPDEMEEENKKIEYEQIETLTCNAYDFEKQTINALIKNQRKLIDEINKLKEDK